MHLSFPLHPLAAGWHEQRHTQADHSCVGQADRVGGGVFSHESTVRPSSGSRIAKKSMNESTVFLPAGSPWNDKQIARFTARVAMFQRRGRTAEQAEELADRLAVRDAERDDRRACIECVSYRQDGNCGKHKNGTLPDVVSRDFRPLPTTLQRCPVFEFQVPA